MIKEITIRNFKSVVNLPLDLGTFNVLIGENGCGKSNILEAIAFGAAASANKLDFEFLGSRGIRVTNPEFMYSAFANEVINRKIEIDFKIDDGLFNELSYVISSDSINAKKWINESKEVIGKYAGEKLATILFDKNEDEKIIELKKIFADNQIEIIEKLTKNIKEIVKNKNETIESKELLKFIFNVFLKERYSNESVSNFIIYSPEQSTLRRFEETTQIYPLGIRGEGLFQYLKELNSDKKNKNKLSEIKDNLTFLDWYENFDLPTNLLKNEISLNIKDKYINENLKYFDQRSTNEGFLYLLFYATLFISKTTPEFFAIDNIDASLNPKLCMQLTRNLSALAKKFKKQVIVTTQNPAILDGLNLKDENQRLFVVSRNSSGHTRAERIKFNKDRTMKLSDVWTKGFIGGLPSNF